MSKLAKFRRGPAVFFADVKSPLLRALGARMAPVLERPVVRQTLLDPLATLEGVALLSPVAERVKQARQLHRTRLLEEAGHPLVSVVMAAWNAGTTVEAAIESMQAQSYDNFELIVVDDGSSDDTCAVVRRFVVRDPRIRLVHLAHNAGAAHARNVGLHEAQGEFLSFHDADDFSHPQRIERQLCAILRSPQTMFSLCNYSRVDDEGQVLSINGREVSKSVISMMFRRQVFTRIGYFRDFRISEDAEYYERMKLIFGAGAEHLLAKVLYLQGFSPASLLFSDGKTEREGDAVEHQRSAEAEQKLREIQRLHLQIRSGEDSGFVPYLAGDG